jgi:LemA protein
MNTAILLLIIMMVITLAFISINNRFKRVKVRIEQSLSSIDAALTRRYDTLAKLVDATKGHLNHEINLFSDIVKLRQSSESGDIHQMNKLSDSMASLTKGLQVTLENYPDLKSQSSISQLNHAVIETEDELFASRRLYNSNVAIYNELIDVFPSSIIASMNHYTKASFFEAEEHKREDIKIDLS